jgi:hypothetical protein
VIRGPMLAVAVVGLAACPVEDTSRLTEAVEARLAEETVLFRAANLTFRYTHDTGSRNAGWEDRVASIVVTPLTVLIHKNDRIGIEITPRSRRFYEVQRDADRVRLNAGSGQSRESWSFVPPADADGWSRAIRAAIRNSNSVANP